MDDETKDEVRGRAGYRCEYCHIPERYFTQRFQIEHIRARCHGGSSDSSNLALACRRCNLHKGPNASGFDHDTDELTPLFNPREGVWSEHFEQLPSGEIVGQTAVGRTTVYVLAMNDHRRVSLRAAIAVLESETNQ